MRAPLLALLAALCAAALLPGSLGDIVSDSLDHDARSIVLVARPFGFEANGMVDVKVSNWRVYLEAGKPKYDPNKIGFFITTAEAEVQLQQDLAAGASSLFGTARGVAPLALRTRPERQVTAAGHPRACSLRCPGLCLVFGSVVTRPEALP